ncbi:nuclear transport factor 2 family protein, partial [Oleiphilus sp. HI0086]
APKVIQNWHTVVKTRDINALDNLLADNATMFSPVVHTPQRGKAITKLYLMGAMQTIANEHFKYIQEVYNDHFAVLEFETLIDGKTVNGVDMITWNEDDQITEFKVMLRPLQGINAVHKAMGEALAKFQQGQ